MRKNRTIDGDVEDSGAGQSSPYRINPHVAKLAAGIDPDRMNALVDELEDEEIVARMRHAWRRR